MPHRPSLQGQQPSQTVYESGSSPDRIFSDNAIFIDVGCALGRFPALPQRLHPRARIFGVDIDFRDPDYLAVTRKLRGEAGSHLELVATNVLESITGVPSADLLTANLILSGTATRDSATVGLGVSSKC